jgi:hypothetical protein
VRTLRAFGGISRYTWYPSSTALGEPSSLAALINDVYDTELGWMPVDSVLQCHLRMKHGSMATMKPCHRRMRDTHMQNMAQDLIRESRGRNGILLQGL